MAAALAELLRPPSEPQTEFRWPPSREFLGFFRRGTDQVKAKRDPRAHRQQGIMVTLDPHVLGFFGDAQDDFGKSSIAGEVRRQGEEFRIRFVRTYQADAQLEYFGGFRVLEHEGLISLRGAVVSCSGRYRPLGAPEEFHGVWLMDNDLE